MDGFSWLSVLDCSGEGGEVFAGLGAPESEPRPAGVINILLR